MEYVTVKENILDALDRKIQTGEIQSAIANLFSIEALASGAFLVKDIFQAHRDQKFTLSVPCLIIQIEGIMHDLAYEKK